MATLIRLAFAVIILAAPLVLMFRLRIRLVRARRSQRFCRNCWSTRVDLATDLRCGRCGAYGTGPLPRLGSLLILISPLAIGVLLNRVIHEFSPQVPNMSEDTFAMALQLGPIVVLSATSTILFGLLPTRKFGLLTLAWAVPTLTASCIVLCGMAFPDTSEDLMGMTVVFLWMLLSAAGLVLGSMGQAIVAGILLLSLRDPEAVVTDTRPRTDSGST